MPRTALPDNLTSKEVENLTDALLANADVLLATSAEVLSAGRSGLARSLAILGLEESGKAIALHNRRVEMAWAPDGTPFVDAHLQSLWARHDLKLRAVHVFLRQEQYWFGEGPPIEADKFVLDEINKWSGEKNRHKQSGFYVDVDTVSGVVSRPSDINDAEAVAQVLDRVHQIGWQLRLGEHIEARRLEERARRMSPASDAEVSAAEQLLAQTSLPQKDIDDLISTIRSGDISARPITNVSYLHRFRTAPFEDLGKPGYEAQDRELWRLWTDIHGGGEVPTGETDAEDRSV